MAKNLALISKDKATNTYKLAGFKKGSSSNYIHLRSTDFRFYR